MMPEPHDRERRSPAPPWARGLARLAAAALIVLPLFAGTARAGSEDREGLDRPPPRPPLFEGWDPGPGRPPPPPPPRHRGGPGPGGMIDRYAERLGLDDGTRAKIREIAGESRRRGEAIKERLERAHDEMRGLLSRDAPDEAAVMRQAEVISALELEERKSRLRSMLRIRALLTPDQRAELVRILERERPRRRDRPPPGPPGR